MDNITDKADSTAGATGQLPAAEYNDHKNEIQKVVTKSGQTLSAGITDQLSKAVFINAIGAASMVDSGSGNSITLNPVTGGSGLVPPGNYVDFNGGVVCFNKADPNTGTAVTIAPWGLTAKPLVRKDLSLPLAGDVIGECFAKWDNSADKWILLRNETDTYKYLIPASGAVAPKFANNEIEVDLSGGNVSISALPVPDFIGQKIHIYGVGSGIGDIAGGTGLYVNGVYFTENTGGVYLTAVSLTEWRAENGVTADYVSSNENIEITADGDMTNSFLMNAQGDGTANQVIASVSFAVAFSSIKSSSLGGVSRKASDPTTPDFDIVNYDAPAGATEVTAAELTVSLTARASLRIGRSGGTWSSASRFGVSTVIRGKI